MAAIPTVTLNDGHVVPRLCFGSPDAPPEVQLGAFAAAFEAGYRHIDTARSYGNEQVVGQAVARSELPREQILVQTKLPGKGHGYHEALASFEVSRRALGVDYVDVYLIHWPNPALGKYVDTWRAMIHLRAEGAVRSIGVANFPTECLLRLRDETGVLPVLNQIERHPRWPNQAQVAADADLGVLTQAWSPLGRGNPFIGEPAITAAAAAHGVSPAQVALRWSIQGGAVPVTYSRRPERIAANARVFGFTLTDVEMSAISALETGRLWGQDPTQVDNSHTG
jgi:diketogulonate reductase-like aldo/keto reductase